jgi:hypothetical protein
MLTPESSSEGGLSSQQSVRDEIHDIVPLKAVPQFDSIRHEGIRKPTVDVTICGDTSKVLGTCEEVLVMAGKYFDNLSHRLPFISRGRFCSRLPSLYTHPHADFSLLCLCIHLVTQYPPRSGKNMQSSLYVMIKGHIGLLEASGYLSVEFVQARLLVSIFEMGHGIYPAASISIGACARAARALGLHKKRTENPLLDDTARIRAEERRRIWWEIVNVDR